METQLITNTVLVLRKANIFPVKDFDDWEAVQPKIWATMKTFFHEAFTRRLNAISMNPTSGQHGYTNPNPYAIFNTKHNEDDTSTTSTNIHWQPQQCLLSEARLVDLQCHQK
jgi:hypothetical protein